MVEDGRCLQRGFDYAEQSFILIAILVIVAFTLGAASSHLLRSLFGIFLRLNSRKSSNLKNMLPTQELPKLPATVPKHVAVIMDGNRRYGRLKHADALQGHWAGGQTLVDFIQWCMLDGIEIATVYAFSTENWNRDPSEVNTLMSIFAKYAESLTTEASTRNVRVRILSTDFEKLPPKVRISVIELEKATAECTGFLVNICLSYGSRAEIVMACNAAIAEKQHQNDLERRHGGMDRDVPDTTDLGSSSLPIIEETNSSTGTQPGNDVVDGDNFFKQADNHHYDILHNASEKCDEEAELSEVAVIGKSSSSSSCCKMNSDSASFSVGSRHLPIRHYAPFSGDSSSQVPSLLPSLSVDDEALSRHMCTASIPDPDVLIRTSGEFRISNFLLWQMAYTEMFFVDKFWPEITHRDLRVVLQQFDERQRRFGV